MKQCTHLANLSFLPFPGWRLLGSRHPSNETMSLSLRLTSWHWGRSAKKPERREFPSWGIKKHQAVANKLLHGASLKRNPSKEKMMESCSKAYLLAAKACAAARHKRLEALYNFWGSDSSLLDQPWEWQWFCCVHSGSTKNSGQNRMRHEILMGDVFLLRGAFSSWEWGTVQKHLSLDLRSIQFKSIQYGL